MVSGEAGVMDEDLPRPGCGFLSVAGDMGLVIGLTPGEPFERLLRTGPVDLGVVTVFKPFTRSEVGLRFVVGR